MKADVIINTTYVLIIWMILWINFLYLKAVHYLLFEACVTSATGVDKI